jgi:predicted kinase
MEPRPLDRLDHRLAGQRLRGRHVRALGRALAALHGETGRRAPGALSLRALFLGKAGAVHFARSPGRVATDDVASLVGELVAEGAPRRAEQLAAAYAFAADDYALYRKLAPLGGEPLVVATGGRVASGKSTVAKAVSRRLAAPRIVGDRVRRALAADAPGHELAWARSASAGVYAGLLERAEDVLAGRRSLVLDACFPTARERRAAAALAARYGARFVFACCDAPPAELAARLRLRDLRDAVPPGSWEKIASEIDARWERPDAGEPGSLVHLDTSLTRGAWLVALGLAKRGRA